MDIYLPCNKLTTTGLCQSNRRPQIGDPRTLLLDMTDPEASELAKLPLSDRVDELVNLLLQLRSLTGGSVGDNAENDLIVCPERPSSILIYP
jgi:hypothetical protein